MPLYEFKCNDCGDEFERMLRFSEADQAAVCPTCLSQRTARKISTIASRRVSLGGPTGVSASSCAPRGGFS